MAKDELKGGMLFELYYRKEPADRVGTKWTPWTEERAATLPDRPPQFNMLRGSHSTVAARADELNRIQERSGFRHYFFFPDVAKMATASA